MDTITIPVVLFEKIIATLKEAKLNADETLNDVELIERTRRLTLMCYIALDDTIISPDLIFELETVLVNHITKIKDLK
jgi:hypothetical protein